MRDSLVGIREVGDLSPGAGDLPSVVKQVFGATSRGRSLQQTG